MAHNAQQQRCGTAAKQNGALPPAAPGAPPHLPRSRSAATTYLPSSPPPHVAATPPPA